MDETGIVLGQKPMKVLSRSGKTISAHCYRLGWTSIGNDWSDTRDLCESLNASLLELTNQPEYNFIRNWLKAMAPQLPTNPITTTTTASTAPVTNTDSLVTKHNILPSFTSKWTSTWTSGSASETSYTYVTCYVAPSQTSTNAAGTVGKTIGVTDTEVALTTTPVPHRSKDCDEFDPSTHPDMAIIPASIGLTAMVVLALSMIGIVILDVGALKRDTKKLIRNVRHACKKVKSGRVHSETGTAHGRKAAGRKDPELEELSEKA
ncbi:hypothetical protein LSH36_840g02010 [Paralvinella palmiformis]|uniref:C-type lectin domain-containing protein n=1 Tax=Paralvinella palmiformis TaxID=53620 RepID=A0AAD9MUG3_9ANNE|nr:hypothetical protein LSH36_840g02010 [Paralvinella palmiformis]